MTSLASPLTAVLACCALLFSAGCTRTVRIESSPPARIVVTDQYCVACTRTPCEYEVSVPRCSPNEPVPDGNDLHLEAVLPDRRHQAITISRCEIQPHQVVRFDFVAGQSTRDTSIDFEPSDEFRLCGTETRTTDSNRDGFHLPSNDPFGGSAAVIAAMVTLAVISAAVPRYTYEFGARGNHGGLAWEVPVLFPAGAPRHVVDAALNWYPNAGNARGRLGYRYVPKLSLCGPVCPSFGLGAFVDSTGFGPRSEARAHWRLLKLGGPVVAAAYALDVHTMRHIGEVIAGVEFPLILGW